MPRKHRKRTPSLDLQAFRKRILFTAYCCLWDMEPGFSPHAPTQPGFRAFYYFGA
jgi:hypothetical protein